MSLHAFDQRILADDLVRVRRPDERGRFAAAQEVAEKVLGRPSEARNFNLQQAAQRQARIDPSPKSTW